MERLKLESVAPLLEYLHGLPQECCDRPLAWIEDEWACLILLELSLPDDRELEDLVLYYASPDYRPSRTLCVWYGIARAVARCVQDGL